MDNLKRLNKSELFEKIGTAVLVGHVDGTPMMYGMDRIAAVLDTVPAFGSMGKEIVAIYGHNMTLGGSDYGVSWDAYEDEQGKRDAVVHGRWVYEGYDGRFVHSWHCSGCEHVIRGSANLTKAYSFCNRCGALMDAQEGVAVE